MKATQFTPLYLHFLRELLEHPDYTISPHGTPCREIMGVKYTLLDPTNGILDFTVTGMPERQVIYDNYRKAEMAWYLSGDRRASSAPSKFWLKIADPDGMVQSNYGYLMLHEKRYPTANGEKISAINHVVNLISADADSRQAVVHYNLPAHFAVAGCKDLPCTVASQFLVRENKIHLITFQRSMDCWKGWSYDTPWNCEFLQLVMERLNAKTPWNLSLGTFTHMVGSLHLYERDVEHVKKVLKGTTDAPQAKDTTTPIPLASGALAAS